MGKDLLVSAVLDSGVNVVEVVTVYLGVACIFYGMVLAVLVEGVTVTKEVFVVFKLDSAAELVLDYVKVYVIAADNSDRAVEKDYRVERAVYRDRLLRALYFIERYERILRALDDLDTDSVACKLNKTASHRAVFTANGCSESDRGDRSVLDNNAVCVCYNTRIGGKIALI